MPEAPQRKLAAIMFTDIVGYTALMGEDEQKALLLLKKNREFLKPLVQQFNGEWLKEMGDGTLSSFTSAVDAVNCALEIQHILRHDPDLILRIGIHIGDVVFEEGDVFGDGVNVASRIEPLAEPGGICVSGRVYDDIRNKPDIETVFLGKKTLKHVKYPVKVYALAGIGLPTPLAKLPARKRAEPKSRMFNLKKLVPALFLALIVLGYFAWDWSRSRDPLSAFEHSVAVMPFDNRTGDETYDIWERGIVTLLYTSLTTSGELYVLDVQTLFEVINAIEDVQRAQMIPQLATEVAHRTGVKNVILGDILRAGDQLRLVARLVDVKTAEVVYSPFVEGKSEDDFFAMAHDLADQLKNHLEIKVLAQVKKGYYTTGYELDDVLTTSAQAFRHFLRRGDHNRDPATAIKELTQAVSIDTNFVWAQLQLALAYSAYAELGNTAVRIKEMRNWAEKAYSRKNELPYRYQLMMEVFWCEFEKTPYEEIKWIKKALELNPQNWELWANLGHCWYLYLEQYEPAIEPYKKCIELRKQRGYGSKWEVDISILRNVYHELGEHNKELELIRGLELPNHTSRAQGAAAYLCNGDTAGARTYLTRLQQRLEGRGETEAQIAAWFGFAYQEAGQLDRAEEFYRRAIALDPQGADIDIYWLGYNSALNRLAYLLIENDRDVAEGVELAQQAVQLKAGNNYSLHALGWGYYKQGRYALAVPVLEQADTLGPVYEHRIRQHLEAARKALGAGG